MKLAFVTDSAKYDIELTGNFKAEEWYKFSAYIYVKDGNLYIDDAKMVLVPPKEIVHET